MIDVDVTPRCTNDLYRDVGGMSYSHKPPSNGTMFKTMTNARMHFFQSQTGFP